MVYNLATQKLRFPFKESSTKRLQAYSMDQRGPYKDENTKNKWHSAIIVPNNVPTIHAVTFHITFYQTEPWIKQKTRKG